MTAFGISLIVIGICSIFMLIALNGFVGSLHHRGTRSNGAICGGYVFNRHGFNYQDSHHRSCNFCGVKEEETVTYDGHWYWIVDRRTI